MHDGGRKQRKSWCQYVQNWKRRVGWWRGKRKDLLIDVMGRGGGRTEEEGNDPSFSLLFNKNAEGRKKS